VPAQLRAYYLLTKPGIIRGNLLTAIGGFGLAAGKHYNWMIFVALLVGMSLVIGSACVFNNYLDRDIDARMTRTKQRATVSRSISSRNILIYGSLLAAIGFAALIVWTNWLTTALGLLGLVTYVAVYTPAKHRTPYATLLGTIPGAVPPVAGYTAVTGRLDLASLLLFLILVCWQMPHFYAIAIRRLEEYKAAKVPVWPSVYGLRQTKQQMLWFALAFDVFIVRLSLSGYTGIAFAVVLGAYGLFWAYKCWQGFGTSDDIGWAKSVFLFSLPILPLFSLLLILNAWLP
jgi:protoheme IX farnesyltransferase